jgi:hypothetical protein
MSRGLIFWILMLLWLVLGVWGLYSSRPMNGAGWIAPVGGTLLEFLLFLLLGWGVYGAPVKS